MNLVGELVLARNQILQFTKTQTNSEFVSTSQRLNLITSELQEQVMKTRMQPIANVWNKFPRVVRDVAHQCGKQVRIEMEGKETDLDKTIIEAIKDPLTHIVRNSVDHGIEKPDVRIANGKEAEGRLLLRAFHEGGHVIIEIADDGAGLNTDRIKSKAIERGLITAEKAAKMSEKELNSLIFLPGFSTAEQVTNLSGRGVGMDVVRSNIERIGGSTDLSSTFGKGTTLRIKIPLTLAIVPALIVSCGGERFAIPQVSLVELMRVEGSNIAKQVESIHGSKFYRLRGNLLPLVYLSEELRLKHDNSANLEKLNIVVVKAEERSFGLVVEVVHDTEEIVVKPLGKQLKQLSVFAGATIMGDGRIALILDVLGLARKARVVGEAAKRAAEQKKEVVDTSAASNRQTLLIVQTGKGTRAAVPLAAVHRLEEFPISSIERASGTEVVQYRGGILPLVDLPLLLTGSASIASGDGDQRQVVVYSTGRGVCGFVVDRILDIVEDHVNVQVGSARPGVKGSAIIQKQVTDMLDLDKIIESMPGFTSSSTVS
jgi:two-component system chemotaxis sensor kinase CheA